MSFFTALFYYISAFIIAVLPFNAYIEGVVEQPTSFLPSKASSQNDIAISRLIYRGLFTYDIYGTLIPDLADTWEISEDGLVYTVKIKDNQYWSNGKKVSAEDLIYTSFKVESLNGVATDKVDDLTVRYILPNKYSPFLSLLTMGIMPVDAEDKMNPLKPVSSGEFSVGLVDKRGTAVKKVVLVSRNRELDIRKIVFNYYSNEDELITAAKLGEIDSFLSKNEHKVDNFSNFKFPLQGIYYAFFFNLGNDSFKDITLRQDLEKVLDISKLIYDKGIMVEGPISRSIYTDKQLNFDKYLETYKKDWNNKEITITMADIPSQYDFVKRVKDIWEDRLGVNVNIKKIAPDQMSKYVIEPRDFEILFYGQEVGRDPDRYVNWHSSQKDFPGLNLSAFSHIRADRALEEGRNEITNEGRVVHYNEFQKVMNEQTTAIFLYHPFLNYYVSNRISGVGDKYTFTAYDRFLDFANWERIRTN